MIRYLLILTVSLMPLASLACSCHLGSAKEKFEMFDSVFVGKVVDIQQKGTTNQFNEAEVLVNFQQIMRFKGKDEDTVLDTNINGSSCTGYWFKKGQTMLIYASEINGKLDVMWCGGVVVKEESPQQFALELDELKVVSGNAL